MRRTCRVGHRQRTADTDIGQEIYRANGYDSAMVCVLKSGNGTPVTRNGEHDHGRWATISITAEGQEYSGQTHCEFRQRDRDQKVEYTNFTILIV